LAQFELDVELPEKYLCNGFTHFHFTAQLQESEGAHSALGMSAVLARAAVSTYEILDSHRHNSSLEATIHKVKHVWRPICRDAHVFSCDENNFWDIHYASHRQTMALMQTGNAAALHAEIQTRLRVPSDAGPYIDPTWRILRPPVQMEDPLLEALLSDSFCRACYKAKHKLL